jgi:hypothetical protein
LVGRRRVILTILTILITPLQQLEAALLQGPAQRSIQPSPSHAPAPKPREAALAALREDLEGAQAVAARHFDSARAAAAPALTMEQLAQYESWGRQYSR